MSQAGVINNSSGPVPPTVPTSFVTDNGTAIPAANVLDVFGQQAGTIPVMATNGATNVVHVEDRTWISSLVVDPSATVGQRGTFQTITAALAAASSPMTIYIRPGNYVENITMKAGVNLVALTPCGYDQAVQISGTITANYTGIAGISGIALSALNANTINCTSGAATLYIKDCNLLPAVNDGGPHYFLNLNNAGTTVNIYDCQGHCTPGAAFFNVSTGALNCQNLPNMTSQSSTPEVISGGTADFFQCDIDKVFTCTGGNTIFSSCYIADTSSAAVALALTTGAIVHSYFTTYAATTGQTVITIDAASRLESIQTNLDSDCNVGDIMITNAGTFTYDSITQRDNAAGPGKGIIPAPTSSAFTNYGTCKFRQGQIVNTTIPGAYPYTTTTTDYVILVDTSVARTIIPYLNPVTGTTYRIKDNVGSAAANNITITPSGKNIDGAASYIISSNYGSADIVYNGTQWNVV